MASSGGQELDRKEEQAKQAAACSVAPSLSQSHLSLKRLKFHRWRAASKAGIRKQARRTLLRATRFHNCRFKAYWAKACTSKLSKPSNRDFPAAKWFTSATQEHRHVGHVWACGTCSDPQAHLGCWLFAADSAGGNCFAQKDTLWERPAGQRSSSVPGLYCLNS